MPSRVSGGRRDGSTPDGRVSRPGSIGSPATGLWISTGGGEHGLGLRERTRFETCPVAPSRREVWMVGTSPGLSQREISHRTGLPLGTIKSRSTAALKRLHRSLISPAAEEGRHD